MVQMNPKREDEILLFLAEFIQEKDPIRSRIPAIVAFRGLNYLSDVLKSTAQGIQDSSVLSGPLKQAGSIDKTYRGFVSGSVSKDVVSKVVGGFARDYISYCAFMGIHLGNVAEILENAGQYARREKAWESASPLYP